MPRDATHAHACLENGKQPGECCFFLRAALEFGTDLSNKKRQLYNSVTAE